MPGGIDFKELKVPVTHLQKRVFSKERFSARLDIAVGEEGLYRGEGDGRVLLDIRLQSVPDGIRVTGVIEGQVSMECTRCLEEYLHELHIKVDEFYRRPGLGMVDERGGRAGFHADKPEEDAYVIDDGGFVDLNVLVNDNIMLNLPIKYLCSPECRGLCPICGQNLNRGECGCSRESIDPRLEILRTLLDQEES